MPEAKIRPGYNLLSNGTREHFEFDSLASLLRYVQDPATPCPTNRENASRDTSEGLEFHGPKPNDPERPATWDDAVSMASNGWLAPVEAIRAASARLSRRVGSKIEMPVYTSDVTGVSFDVGEYLTGTPECWSRVETRPARARGNIVRIGLNCAASCVIPADLIERRGSAIASLIALLERQGYRVALDVVSCVTQLWESNPTTCTFRVAVKTANAALDLPRLAFVTAHPSLKRRLGFRLTEACQKRFIAYGRPHTYPDLADFDIYLDKALSTDPQWKDTASAERWVIETLQAQGVKLTRHRTMGR